MEKQICPFCGENEMVRYCEADLDIDFTPRYYVWACEECKMISPLDQIDYWAENIKLEDKVERLEDKVALLEKKIDALLGEDKI